MGFLLPRRTKMTDLRRIKLHDGILLPTTYISQSTSNTAPTPIHPLRKSLVTAPMVIARVSSFLTDYTPPPLILFMTIMPHLRRDLHKPLFSPQHAHLRKRSPVLTQIDQSLTLFILALLTLPRQTGTAPGGTARRLMASTFPLKHPIVRRRAALPPTTMGCR